MTDDIPVLSRRTVLGTTMALAGGSALASPALAQTSQAGSIEWTRPKTTLGSNPVYSAGRVYVVGASGSLVCCDAKTGSDKWAAGVGSEVQPYALAASEDMVVAGTEDGILSAYHAEDGSKAWERSVPGEVRSLQIADSTLIFGLDGAVGAVELASGKVHWPARDGYDTYAPLRTGITDNTVVFASTSISLRAVSLSDGSPEWETELSNWSNEASTAGIAAEDGAVYVGGESGGLLRIQASDGTVTWQTRLDDKEIEAVLVAGEYLVGVGNMVHVFSAETGRRLYSLGIYSHNTPDIRGTELVVGGTTQSGKRVLLGVELSSGTTNWRYSVDEYDDSLSGVTTGPDTAFSVDDNEEALLAIRRVDKESTPTPHQRESSPESTDRPAATPSGPDSSPSASPPVQKRTASDAPPTTDQPDDTASNRSNQRGDNRGFLVPGDNLLKNTLTPWGLTILGFAVSIGGIVYQNFKHR